MKLKKLREILDAIEKKSPEGENADVVMFYDNSHGGGSWEFANPDLPDLARNYLFSIHFYDRETRKVDH